MDSFKHHIGIKYSIIPLLTLYLLFFMGFACHSTAHEEGEGSSEEFLESEIWNPFIILTQEENKLVEAKSEKLYKKRNDAALLVGNVIMVIKEVEIVALEISTFLLTLMPLVLVGSVIQAI